MAGHKAARQRDIPMTTLSRSGATLLAIDLQARMMGAIHDAEGVVAEAQRLITGARLLDVPVVFTEQNPAGLGTTLPGLQPQGAIAKMHFDACREPAFLRALPPGGSAVLMGCEAHVCVLQTALGLMARGAAVAVVADAVGSRRAASKALALDRLARAGTQVVSAEMVLFEWLESADHPRFRDVLALIR